MSPITDWQTLAKAGAEANKGFEPLPADTEFNFTITEAKVSFTKNTNKKQFETTAVVDSGQYKKRKVWNNFIISPESPNSLSIFFQNMAVFGMPIEFFGPGTQDEHIVANLLGARFSAKLTISEYGGKKKNDINALTIKAPTALSELENTNSDVPAGANMGMPTQQMPPMTPQPPVGDPWAITQQPVTYQPVAAPPTPNFQQGPPPPPPASAGNWGTPPPPPPGLG